MLLYIPTIMDNVSNGALQRVSFPSMLLLLALLTFPQCWSQPDVFHPSLSTVMGHVPSFSLNSLRRSMIEPTFIEIRQPGLAVLHLLRRFRLEQNA